MPRPLRVAVVGAGPAGIYAADALLKSEVATDPGVSIDIFERMPAPFGLIRYGVAPDHPRIKGIVTALHQVLDKPQIRLFGNVDYPTDVSLDDLRAFYDAVIFSTGATADRALDIPGIDLDGSYGAADFVSWYDGHPDVPRTWPLTAEKVAVLGVGNVALDVARVLAKTADELLPTEIPANVYDGLKANKALEIHVFGRRGPAQAKFSPMELRELDHSPAIEVVVDPEDIDYDEGSIATRRGNKQADMVAKTLENWAIRDIGDRPHKLFLHFFESPTESSARTAPSSACAPSAPPSTGPGTSRARASSGTGTSARSTAPWATCPTPSPSCPGTSTRARSPTRAVGSSRRAAATCSPPM
jgi:ferredoxin--NADP+ reductase